MKAKAAKPAHVFQKASPEKMPSQDMSDATGCPDVCAAPATQGVSGASYRSE